MWFFPEFVHFSHSSCYTYKAFETVCPRKEHVIILRKPKPIIHNKCRPRKNHIEMMQKTTNNTKWRQKILGAKIFVNDRLCEVGKLSWHSNRFCHITTRFSCDSTSKLALNMLELHVTRNTIAAKCAMLWPKRREDMSITEPIGATQPTATNRNLLVIYRKHFQETGWIFALTFFRSILEVHLFIYTFAAVQHTERKKICLYSKGNENDGTDFDRKKKRKKVHGIEHTSGIYLNFKQMK